MDLLAVALALGATSVPKQVTELTFRPSPSTAKVVFLEDLQQMEEKAAVTKMLSLAFGAPTGPVTR